MSDKFVPNDENSSDSHFIPVKKTSKSCNIPKQKFNLPKICSNELNELSQYHDSGDSKTQTIDLQENSAITYYPDITIAATTSTITMSITTIVASTNIVSTTLPVFTTITKAIIASEVPATAKMAAVSTSTPVLSTAVANFTTAIKNTKVPVIVDTVTNNYDKSEITSTVNENITVTYTAALEDSATLYNTTALIMITNVTSVTINAAVSAAIEADSFADITSTDTDDTTSV